MKKLSLVLMLVVGAIVFAVAQRNITGMVTDEKGEPLIGASILVKGTTAGTVTDIDGKYSVSVPAGSSVLLISYTGFTSQEVTLGVSNVVDVKLAESAEQLAEVVVTAIGIQREKKALGYAVSDLGSDDLAQRSEPDPVRAIAGKTPGVLVQGSGGLPGQSTKINIRGNSSLTGNTQPLFVVDGIPFDNSVNATTGATGGAQYSNRAFDLDPNNIESMTILKGAAAAALYGSRATNGVIVVTTKTGAKKRKGLEVTYNSSFQVEQLSGIPDYQGVYGQGANQVYNGGFIGNWGAPFADQVDRINSVYDLYFCKEKPRRLIQTLTLDESWISNGPFRIPAGQAIKFYMRSPLVPRDLTLITVLPHMHLLGKSFKAFAITPAGQVIHLINIPEWNFNWQMSYEFQHPIKLPKGSVIYAEAVYDNTLNNPRNPFSPPREATYGWGTYNEMMNLIIEYLDYQPGDEQLDWYGQNNQ